MKKLIVVLVVMSMLTLATACSKEENVYKETKKQETSEAAVNQSDKQSEEKVAVEQEEIAEQEFDERFWGGWTQVSKEISGDLQFDVGLNLYFLYDGSFYGDVLEYDYHEIVSHGWECPVATVSGDILDWTDAAFRFDESIDEKMDYSGISMTTTFEFKDNDVLTLHITGTYEDGPTSTKKIDGTFVYEKKYPVYAYDYLEPSLNGTWTDNKGNSWTFGIDSEKEFQFELEDKSGNHYTGIFVNNKWSKDDPECMESLEFLFVEDINIPEYDIVSYDGKSFILRESDGEDELILTRTNR